MALTVCLSQLYSAHDRPDYYYLLLSTVLQKAQHRHRFRSTLKNALKLSVRLYGSAQFIIFQLVRISIVMYLPAIVLSTITGINIYLCILSMGLLSTFYTVLGGIEAVIWTDVFQVIIFFGGIIVALVIIPFHIEGGVIELFKTGIADDKFRILYLEWDMTATTFWAVVIGGGVGTFFSYTADQSMIQRYLTTKDEKAAAKGYG